MQPPSSFSVPRRPLDIEDYIDIARRHKAWVFGPAFASLVIAVVIAFLWPDTYSSTAVVRILPSQVPERYVATNINMEMSQRVDGMAQQILSRVVLTDLIITLSLYPKKVKHIPMEDLIEEMRHDIHIGNVAILQQQNARVAAFHITFSYDNRFLAQKVTSAILTKFLNENITSRYEQSQMTTEFLKDKWEDSKKRLDELEAKLTEFRRRNLGKLPEQLDSNLQQLNTMGTQLASINEEISRIDQSKMLLETDLRGLNDRLNLEATPTEQITPGGPQQAAAKDARLLELEREIVVAENNLEGLRQHYTNDHPDVKRFEGQILVLKKERDKLLKEEAAKKPAQAPTPDQRRQIPADARTVKDLQSKISRLETEIKNRDAELKEREKDRVELEKSIKDYRGRLEAGPASQQEYDTLMRDYNLAKARYEEMNTKKTQSEMASDLENQKRGETLEVLDPASLPETPEKPNRMMIILSGIGIGFAFGLFLVGAREMKDTSLKNLKDVRAYTNLPVLGSVPLLENDLIVRRKRRLTWLAWSAACMIGAVAMAGSVYFHYATKT